MKKNKQLTKNISCQKSLSPNQRYRFFTLKQFTLGAVIILLLGWGGEYLIAKVREPKQPPPPNPPLIIDKTPFQLWEPSVQQINDLIHEGNRISLSEKGYKRQRNDIQTGRPVRDPQGYIQSPQSISENVFICTKVLSHTDEIDYSLRLNYKFQVIHGDGDGRSISLKQISSVNPNGDYIRPDTGENDPHIDHLNRFRLDVPLPVGKEFTSCLTIHAPAGEISKTITVELIILDDQGQTMDLGPMPKWTLIDSNQQNSTSNNFSVGLIDSRGAHPILELRGYCAVEMNDLGDQPSDREREACIHT